MRRLPVVLLVLLLAGGCLPEIEVRMRTRVMPDGSTLRETRYMKHRNRPDTDEEKQWNERPIRDDVGARVGEGFGSVRTTDDELSFSGSFASAAAIPPDFVRDVAVLGATSTNRIEFQTEDLLFGTRYLYRERFLDAIVPEDQKATRSEFVRFIGAFVRDVASDEFDREYELDRFDAWVTKQLEPFVDGMIDIYWSERRSLDRKDPHSGQTGGDRVVARMMNRLEGLGLSLDPKDELPIHALAVMNWVCELLARTLSPRKPGATTPQTTDFAYLFAHDAPLDGLVERGRATAIRRFGSTDAFEAEFQRRLLGVIGTYGSPPAEATFRFDCAVELPGALLRTNGILESERSSFWLFDGQEIFPNGFVLEAESVLLASSLLGRIREVESELDRRHAVRLIAALKDVSADERAAMAKLLELCARAHTLAALPEPTTDAERTLRRKLDTVVDVVRRKP